MPEESPKPCVLVVDDTPENVDVLVGILGTDYRVKVALNGEKALKVSRSSKPPNLILLDVMMPGMDGYEVCKQLQEDDATKDIPVIFVTGKTESDEVAKGMELGAVDYIFKPIDPAAVLEKVGHCVIS